MIRLAHCLALPLMLLGASALAAERLGGYAVDPAPVWAAGQSDAGCRSSCTADNI